MLRYKTFAQEQSIEENFFGDFFKNIIAKFIKACKAILNKLKPGGKVRIPFNVPKLMNEEYLIMGGYTGPILGNYAETIAGVLFLDKMRDRGYKIDDKSYKEIVRKKTDYAHSIDKSIKTGLKPNGEKIPKPQIVLMKTELPNTSKRADATAERMANIIIDECKDSKFCRFGLRHSGGENNGKDTADVIVEKQNEKKITEQLGFSLKHYFDYGPGEDTDKSFWFKGTNKFAIGVLAKVFNHDKVSTKTFHLYADEIYKGFPNCKKLVDTVHKEWKLEQDSWQKLSAETDGDYTIGDVKTRYLEDRGGDKLPLEVQSMLYEQLLHEAIVERPDDVKAVILEMLDLRPNSPRVVGALGYPEPQISKTGKEIKPGGFFAGYNRYSKEVQKIINANLKDIDIQIISNIKPVSPTSAKDEIYRRLGRTQRIGSSLKMRFKVKGQDVPFEIGSQLYPNGQCQWDSFVFGMKTSDEIKFDTDQKGK